MNYIPNTWNVQVYFVAVNPTKSYGPRDGCSFEGYF